MTEADEHRTYLADDVRLCRYAAALQQIVSPGDVVLDLGAGTGILGFFALQAGAKHVYSVDSGNVIEVAGRIAQSNEFLGVSFIQDHSAFVRLPERVDVVVCDQMSSFGFEAGLFQVMHDAATRHMREGGTLVPNRLDFEFAPLSSPELRAELDVWRSQPHAVDLSSAAEWATNQEYTRAISRSSVIGTPCQGGSFNTATQDGARIEMRGSSAIEKSGTVDAVAAWFIAHLAPGVTVSNSPLDDDPIARGVAVLPIERSVPVSAGDHVDMVLRANPETGHISWSVDIWSVDCRSTTFSGSYSTLVGSLVSGPDLVKIGPDRIPHLGDRGRAELDALRLVNGELSISEISSRFFASHRGMFRSPVDARDFVREVISRAER